MAKGGRGSSSPQNHKTTLVKKKSWKVSVCVTLPLA